MLRTAHIEQVIAIEEQESSEFMKRFNRQVDETLVILFKILEIGHEPQFSNRTALVVEMFYQAANIHADRTVCGDLYLLFLWESRIFIDYPFITHFVDPN